MDLIRLLDQEPPAWNKWRKDNPEIRPDLSNIDLSGKDLSNREFHYVNFSKAKLIETDLSYCSLSSADFTLAEMQSSKINHTHAEWADFSSAHLDNATMMDSSFEKARLEQTSMRKVNAAGSSFEMALLTKANLSDAYLSGAYFLRTDLRGVKLDNARLGLTLFVDTNLYGATGLETCKHGSFSFVDHRTIAQSGVINVEFLRGCGLPEALIRHYPDLVKGTIRYVDCFISCSEADIVFAESLYENLEGNGVKCWLYKHDLAWGARQWDAIDAAIERNDKLILVLSQDSIQSEWVEDEVQKAFATERTKKIDILLPLRLDTSVMTTTKPWASKIKDSRNIADFQSWKDKKQYHELLERLLDHLLKENPKYK